MIIKSINIKEYGGLTDKKIEFFEGLNLVKGKNESGKSTACAFIRFIFYGHSAPDRKLHASVLTGVSSGSIDIIHSDGKTYTVNRHEVGNKSKVNVFCKDDSTDLSLSVSPGEYFLGIPQDLYTRSLFISQKGNDELDQKTSDSVTNILTSGNDRTSVANAKKSLDKQRKFYMHKIGRGGLIHDTEDEISGLRREYDTAVEKKLSQSKASDDITAIRESLERHKQDRDSVIESERHATLMNISEIQSDITNLRSALTDIDNDAEKLKKDVTYEGFFATDEYMSELRRLSHEYDIAEQNAKTLASSPRLEPARPKGYDTLRWRSENEIKANWELLAGRKKKHFALMLCSFILGAALLSLSAVSLIFTALGAVFALSGAVFAAGFNKTRCDFTSYSNEIGCTSVEEISSLCRHFAEYDEAMEQYSKIADAIRTAEEAAKTARERLEYELGKWGKSSLDEAESAFDDFKRRLEELGRRKIEANAQLQRAEGRLSAYSDEDIALAAEMKKAGKLDRPLESGVKKDLKSLETLIKLETEQLHEKEKELSRSEGENPTDISELALRIEEKESALTEYNLTHEAIELAYGLLDTAERNIRGQFIPAVSALGGSYFSDITQSKYSSLSLSDSFGVSCSDSGGNPTRSEHLSGGSYALAWFCLRLALCGRLSDGGEPLPMILDEPFVYFDDERLTSSLALIQKIANNGTQIILFSASDREERALGENFNSIKI